MNESELVGLWHHAHEEDDGRHMVFRREGADLPLSRGRASMDLQADGSAVRTDVGPTDRPQQQRCAWRLEGDDLILSDGGVVLRRMHVASAAPDRLVVERPR